MKRRKPLTPRQLEAKKQEWKKQQRRVERGPRLVRWDEIPDGDEMLVAIKPERIAEAAQILANSGVKALRLGALDQFCGRHDHA